MDPTPLFRHNDIIALPDGTVLETHPTHRCAGGYCCIHNPSDHPLSDAPLSWWRQLRSLQRICSHGFNHPDPDDFAFKVRARVPQWILAIVAAHDCDGCCHWPTEDQDSTE